MVVPDFMEAQIPQAVVVSAIRKMQTLSIAKRGIWGIATKLVQYMYRFMEPQTAQRLQQQRA